MSSDISIKHSSRTSSPHPSIHRPRSLSRKIKLSKRTRKLIQMILGEILGTGMLMFFGCLSLVNGFNYAIPSMQPGLMFGFVVSTVIVIFGHISGAHLNPSVSISAYIFNMMSVVELIVYILAQMLGAVLGVGLIYVITPEEILFKHLDLSVGFCTTVPHANLTTAQAFLAEFFATSILIFTCCGVWDERNSLRLGFGDSNCIKFALVVSLCSITIGPYTGSSMNPARSFAPGFYSNVWSHHWIYWVAPCLSSVLTSLLYKYIFINEDTKGMPREDEGDIDVESRNPINS